jgi:hypothetical protein
MESMYNFVQLYSVWVNGRSIENVDQHFPLTNNVERTWYNHFSLAVKDFYRARVLKKDFYPECFQDYIVTLFVIEIDIPDFEDKYKIKFDLFNEDFQELIPYYVDYNFNTVAERITKFKLKK